MQTIAELLAHIPQTGRLEWIGLSPARWAPIEVVQHALVQTNVGLAGDYHARAGSKRQITLLQFEHLNVVAALMKRGSLAAELLRRNLLVSGINLLALKDRQFSIGEVILEGTGQCHPCSRMEQNLGSGGYNALRGHGGITARVISGGELHVGDPVKFLKTEKQAQPGLFDLL